QSVEARARRVEQLVERPVVVLPHAARVGQLPPRRRHPHGFVALLEIVGQLAVRHQVERADLHGSSLFGRGVLSRVYAARKPPSTTSSAPVMYEASSDARKSTA